MLPSFLSVLPALCAGKYQLARAVLALSLYLFLLSILVQVYVLLHRLVVSTCYQAAACLHQRKAAYFVCE